jgi:hypothetical protein
MLRSSRPLSSLSRLRFVAGHAIILVSGTSTLVQLDLSGRCAPTDDVMM